MQRHLDAAGQRKDLAPPRHLEQLLQAASRRRLIATTYARNRGPLVWFMVLLQGQDLRCRVAVWMSRPRPARRPVRASTASPLPDDRPRNSSATPPMKRRRRTPAAAGVSATIGHMPTRSLDTSTSPAVARTNGTVTEQNVKVPMRAAAIPASICRAGRQESTCSR